MATRFVGITTANRSPLARELLLRTQKQHSGLWRGSRWILLSVTFITVIALLLTVWSGYRSAQHISTLVVRAEGYAFFHSIRRRLVELNKEPSSQDLQAILQDLQNSGLHYLGIYHTRGKPIAEVGSPVGKTTFPVRRRTYLKQEVQVMGQRVRMLGLGVLRVRKNPWRIRNWPTRPWAPEMHGPAPFPRSQLTRRTHTLHALIIEFEPLSARLVQREAQRSLMVGGLAALALLLATTFFWVVLRRLFRLEEQRQKEHQLALLGEMSAVLAHEIRNPLTSLKGHAQLLAEWLPEESKPRAKADRVIAEAVRLEELSSQLLDFVRMGNLECSSVDPAQLVQDITESLGSSHFSLDTQHAPQRWNLDPTRIRQVFSNLFENAIHASPDPASIEIRVFQEHQHLIVEVRDHGPGIAPDLLEKIFAPFFTTKFHGTGLGLAVAQRLVRMHGGSLRASNHPQGGAIFVISLPQSRPMKE